MARKRNQLDETIEALAKSAIQNWAAGFTAACEDFGKGWPAKAMSKHDRAMLQLIHDGTANNPAGADLRTVGQWLSSRYERNE